MQTTYKYLHTVHLSTAIERINRDIGSVWNWSSDNGLLLNASKTQAIIMGTSRFVNSIDLSTAPSILANGTVIQYQTHVKYLGVTISNNLSWDKHVSHVTNKVRSVLYRLKLSKHLVPDSLKIRLVTALVSPHIDYCCAVFTDISAELNRKLYRATNACLRYIFKARGDESMSGYYARLRWLKTDTRRSYFVGCLLYRILSSDRPKLLRDTFVFRRHVL